MTWPQPAEQLVPGAVKCPILLLMPLRKLNRSDALYRPAAAGDRHLNIHDPQQIEQFAQFLGLKMDLHRSLRHRHEPFGPQPPPVEGETAA